MTRRSRHGHAWLAGAMIAALALLGAGAVSAQTVTWSMADEYPATSIQGEADARFAREVSRRTGAGSRSRTSTMPPADSARARW